MQDDDDSETKLIFNKYVPQKKLGEGSFGKIFIAKNVETNELFAVKMVRNFNIILQKEPKDSGQSLLETESYILCHLKGCK